MLYMFQADSPPIIRSSNCTHSIWYMSILLAATASVGELEMQFQITLASGSSKKFDIYQMLCVQF
jgi:hypothetical protein